MKVKPESEVARSGTTLSNPWTAAHQVPPSMGFSSQEYWSGVPLPSLWECSKRSFYLENLRNLNGDTDEVVQCVRLEFGVES